MDISGTSGNDSLTGTEVDDFLRGLAGNDTLTGLGGNDTLDAGTGGDRLIGGTGNDTYIVDGPGDTVIENTAEGIDTVRSSASRTLDANVENLTLTGTASIFGVGNSLNNVITGNSGNNTLNGDTGADRLIGGAGNDTYIVDGPGDTVVENAGGGIDLIFSSASRTLDANVENLYLMGTAAIDGTGNSLNNDIQGTPAANVLNGGTGADFLMGHAGDDTYIVDGPGDTVIEELGQGIDTVRSSATRTLDANVENLMLTGSAAINGTGNSLNNIITGNSANNVLDGAAGIDHLVGGAGNDTYIVEQRDDRVFENPGEGIDTVLSSATLHELDANVENLTLIAGGLNGWGNTQNNVIRGNSLDNVLNGVTGADTLIGGAGNDTYLVDGPGDRITESAGEGIDSVQAWASHTLAANVENLLLADITAINGTGNALSNAISGNDVANTLAGGDGNDTLLGMGANDMLSGGGGSDRLEGRTGDDRLTGGSGRDYFAFVDGPSSGGLDHVADFVRGTDELLFENAGFTELGTSGALAAGDGRFRSGSNITTGQDSSDRLIYDTFSDSLYYDPDGSGSLGSQLIATFAGNPTQSASDITII